MLRSTPSSSGTRPELFHPRESLEETWAQIKDAPKYEVSSLGLIREIASGKYLKISKSMKGNLSVKLRLGSRGQKTFQLSRVVADAFLPRTYMPFTFVRMKDGDRSNCRVDNLVWALRPQVIGWDTDRKPMLGEWRYYFEDWGE